MVSANGDVRFSERNLIVAPTAASACWGEKERPLPELTTSMVITLVAIEQDLVTLVTFHGVTLLFVSSLLADAKRCISQPGRENKRRPTNRCEEKRVEVVVAHDRQTSCLIVETNFQIRWLRSRFITTIASLRYCLSKQHYRRNPHNGTLHAS